MIEDPYIKIRIPYNAAIAEGTLYLNDDPCTDYTYRSPYITIPASAPSGRISFSLDFEDKSDYVTYATLNYTKDGSSDFDIIDIISNSEHEHVWNTDYTDVVPATCKSKGIRSIYCSVCGELKPGSAVSTDMTEHEYGDWKTVTEATTEKEGKRIRKCVICGDVQNEIIPKNDPSGSEDGNKSICFIGRNCTCIEVVRDQISSSKVRTLFY